MVASAPGNQNQILLLQEAFGPRYRRVGPRKVVLNLTFWAHFLVGKMRLIYHVQRQAFFVPNPAANDLERITVDHLLQLTTHGLQQAATLEPSRFPVAELRLSKVKQLVNEMRVVAALHTPGERDALVQFLSEDVVARKGSDLTVAEIHGRYSANCRTKMLPLFAASVFQRLLPGLVTDLFGVIKSHDLQRRGPDGSLHWHRGFHGLGFRAA